MFTYLYNIMTDKIMCVNSLFAFYAAPGRGTGIVFGRFLSFFVSLSATLRENGWTDLHETFREGLD